MPPHQATAVRFPSLTVPFLIFRRLIRLSESVTRAGVDLAIHAIHHPIAKVSDCRPVLGMHDEIRLWPFTTVLYAALVDARVARIGRLDGLPIPLHRFNRNRLLAKLRHYCASSSSAVLSAINCSASRRRVSASVTVASIAACTPRTTWRTSMLPVMLTSCRSRLPHWSGKRRSSQVIAACQCDGS